MNTSVIKLMSTSISITQAYMYFNIYLCSSVYFGADIITLNKQQCRELKRIYEEPILVKLKLSQKMPKDILYIHCSALGIGLITPETVVAIATL